LRQTLISHNDARMSLPDEVIRYRDRGRWVKSGSHRVFVFESEPPGRETLLLLHGFPTSSYDFTRLAAALDEHYRIVTLDYLGFGLSDKPADFGYSIFEHADAVEIALRELETTRCHVLGHDLGTSVLTELLARRERGLCTFTPISVTLMNGSVHIELSQLTPIQRLLLTPLGPIVSRLGSETVFRLQMRRLFSRSVDDEELSALWELMSHNGGRDRLAQTISYVPERHRFGRRWIGALERSELPTHVLWGVRDPVAVMTIAMKLAGEVPGATLTRLAGIGHYPQLEAPLEVAQAVVEFCRNHH
jgi:pimeloyl-ACP methyl ester carboxylesterase